MTPATLMTAWLATSPGWADEVPPSGAEDDLMRPTQYGLRLTPAIAEGLADLWVQDEAKGHLSLTSEQQARMTDIIARRTMELGHANQADLQATLEYLLEMMFGGPSTRFTPQTNQEFARRASPLIPAVRQYFQDIARDTRPMLDPEQVKKLDERMKEAAEKFTGLEKKLQRFAEGQARAGENPFEDERGEDEELPGSGADSAKKRNPRTEAVRGAERSADWNIAQLGPESWGLFLAGAKEFFGFTPEQSAEGDRLLAEYRKRAGEIMTDPWRRRIHRNRVQSHLRWRLGAEPVAPWAYHLDKEYEEATQPVQALGRAFRAEVFKLVTDEQLQKAVDHLRDQAAQHGADAEMLDSLWTALSRLRHD